MSNPKPSCLGLGCFISPFSSNRRKPKLTRKRRLLPNPTAPISISSSSSPKLEHHNHYHHQIINYHYHYYPTNNHDQKLLEAPRNSFSLSQSQDVIAHDETWSKQESNSLGTEVVPQIKIADKRKHMPNVTAEVDGEEYEGPAEDETAAQHIEFYYDAFGDEDEGPPSNRIVRCDSKYVTLCRSQLVGIDAIAEEFIKQKKQIMELEWYKSEQELEQELRDMWARSV